jgi:hypothetical protein
MAHDPAEAVAHAAGRWHRLGLRFVAVRSRVDFNLYLARQRSNYYLGLLGLPLGLVALFRPGLGLALGIAGAIVSLAGIVLSRVERNDDRNRYVYSPLPAAAAGPGGVGLSEGASMLETAAGSAIWWAAIDVELQQQSTVPVVWSDRKYKLPPALAEVAFDVLLPEFRGKSAVMFNGPVVRQDGDLILGVDGWKPLSLSRTKYFDVLCSNYITAGVIRGRGNRLQLEGRGLLVNSRGDLRPLDESDLANAVGVSTIAVTNDGALVLVRQGSQAASSPGLLAPSGSGSLDLRDVPGLRRGDAGAGLLPVIAGGMSRELGEEINVDLPELGRTRASGYWRWWDKGGKPEYSGVTMLELSGHEVRQRSVRRVERNWVKDVIVLDRGQVDLAPVVREPDLAWEVLSGALGATFDRPSMPLVMCVRSLSQVLGAQSAWSEELRERLDISRPRKAVTRRASAGKPTRR